MPVQVLKQNSVDNSIVENEGDVLHTSHQLANELRELYDLPPITLEKDKEIDKEVFSNDIIVNLNGLLKDYDTTDYEDNLVDVIETSRENIS